MDWSHSYEKLMRLEGRVPYGCLYRQCNHVARNTFGAILHWRHGGHDMEHRNRHLRGGKA